MNKFKYKYNWKLYTAMALGVIVALVCLVKNVIDIVKESTSEVVSPYNIVIFSVISLICVAFLVIIAGLLIDSSYVFENKLLVIKFGFVKTTVEYGKIKQIVWFKETDKLTIFYKDETFTNVVIAPSEYTAFADTLCEKNDKIVYYENINEDK